VIAPAGKTPPVLLRALQATPLPWEDRAG